MTALENLIVTVSVIWFFVSAIIATIYISKIRYSYNFDFEEDHIYVADIIVGIICLPVTIILGFCFLGDKLIHIKIK